MKINQTHKNLFVLLVVVGSFFFITKTLALNNPFRPGETRDPSCSPGDLNCTVNLDKNLYKESATGSGGNETSGVNSIAIGSGIEASGHYSIGIGHFNSDVWIPGPITTGNYSIAIGGGTEALGNTSISIGQGAVSEGVESIALGPLSRAVGNLSAALGYGTISSSYRETSLGSFPSTYTPASDTSWNNNDRIFSVGIGQDDANRANALTIIKRGFVGVGVDEPLYTLHVGGTGGIKIPSGAEGERPSDPADGVIRFNTDSGALEYSSNDAWQSLTAGGGGGSFTYVAEKNTGALAPSPAAASATGDYSVAIGPGVIAPSSMSVALGSFNDNRTNDAKFVVGNGTSAGARSNAMVILNNGNIRLGNFFDGSPDEIINKIDTDVGAGLSASGKWFEASDATLKTNIQDLNYGLREVLNIRPRSFDYISDNSPSIGFVAQEVQTIIPELISMSGNGTMGISYGQMTAVLVKAVQELEARVAYLESNSGGQSYSPSPVLDNNEDDQEVPQEEDEGEEGNENLQARVVDIKDITLTNGLLVLAIILLMANLLVAVRVRFEKK